MSVPASWRPPGWEVDDVAEPWGFEQVIELATTATERGWLKSNGKVADDVPARQLAEVEKISINIALIRNCWVTDAGVWRLCERLAGETFKTDPFWNRWSRLDAPHRLDGNDGTDGFDLSQWRGYAGVNGPHSCTKRWLALCAEYGKTQKCAAVFPYRGDAWLWDYATTADLWLHFGRLHFHPPCNLPASSPAGCTIVALWLPEKKRKKIHEVARRVLAGDTVRAPVELRRPERIAKGKTLGGSVYERKVLVTPGCSAEVVDVLGVGAAGE